MGKTFKGVFMNMRIAFSNAGAALLTPLMDPSKELMTTVREALDAKQPFLTELGERIAPATAQTTEAIPRVLAALTPLEGPLLRMVDAAADLVPYLVHGFANWLRVITPIAVPLMEITADLLELTGPLLPVLVPLVFAAGAAFKTWWIIEEKFPALHAALDLSPEGGFLGKAAAGWSMAGDAVGEATGVREWLGTGEHWGSGKGLPRFLHGSDEQNIPAHAAGGWTASGAHPAIVGERGQEFVTNAWASRKIASAHPGALEAMNATGRLPMSPFAVPVPTPATTSVPAAAQLPRSGSSRFTTRRAWTGSRSPPSSLTSGTAAPRRKSSPAPHRH